MWEWSLAMEKARGGYGYGCVPFSWSDFHAFFEGWGAKPRPWQISALRAMESVWLKHWNGKSEKPAKEEPTVGRQFSVGLFDAWFG